MSITAPSLTILTQKIKNFIKPQNATTSERALARYFSHIYICKWVKTTKKQRIITARKFL